MVYLTKIIINTADCIMYHSYNKKGLQLYADLLKIIKFFYLNRRLSIRYGPEPVFVFKITVNLKSEWFCSRIVLIPEGKSKSTVE